MNAHEQFAEDLALYAAGALGPGERAEMEKHLETCAACRRELEQLRGDAALLALGAPQEQPPARARQRLLAAIVAEPRTRRAPRARAWWLWAPALAAGALAAAALALGVQNAGLRREVAQLERQNADFAEGLAGARAVVDTLNDPQAARFTLAAANAPKQMQGKAIYQRERHGLIFLASNLPALPAEKTYELWLIPTSGSPIAAGLFNPDASGSATVIDMQGPALPEGVTAKAFAVTVEPEGGSAGPTTQPVMAGSGA